MLFFGYGHIFFIACFYFACDSEALKCRAGEETQTNEDFEYVVRMCLRQMKNTSRYESFERNFQGMFDQDRGRKDRNWMQNRNKGSGNRNQGDNGSDGFEYFSNPNSGRDRDKDRDQNDRGKMDNDYMEDSDYFHANPLRGMSSDNRARTRPRPHTYQQQVQHDRDYSYGYGHRDNPYSSQNSKRTSMRDKKGESALEQLDACMIHCIFQEMQMLDENGKPDRNVVSEKMSQKIRNPELKSFIQDSVEECFEMIDDESNNSNNRGKGGDNVCVWAKNFAICLEDKGKESCDDWNEPVHRNSKSQNDHKNKNKNSKGGNNRG